MTALTVAGLAIVAAAALCAAGRCAVRLFMPAGKDITTLAAEARMRDPRNLLGVLSLLEAVRAVTRTRHATFARRSTFWDSQRGESFLYVVRESPEDAAARKTYPIEGPSNRHGLGPLVPLVLNSLLGCVALSVRTDRHCSRRDEMRLTGPRDES